MVTLPPYVAVFTIWMWWWPLGWQNNILIDSNCNARVADHGILIMCSELLGTSNIKSNVRWAAPEIFKLPENKESMTPVKPPSDVYSFGCIIFQVCRIRRRVDLWLRSRRLWQVDGPMQMCRTIIKSFAWYSMVQSLQDLWARTSWIHSGISLKNAGTMKHVAPLPLRFRVSWNRMLIHIITLASRIYCINVLRNISL